jgi:hypothetical protein
MDDKVAANLTVLLKAFDHSDTHGAQLRQRAMAVHTWIGSILLAVIGGIIALGPKQLVNFGTSIQLLLTTAIVGLFVFGWVSEILFFRARVAEHEAAVRVIRLLHLFEDNYFGDHPAIFDEREWTAWVNNPLRRAGISPATAVLAVLTSVVTVLIWIA